MKKRILAFLLAVLVCMTALPAMAEVGDAEFTAEPQDVLLGTVVSLKIFVQNSAKTGEALNTLRAVLSYDAEALEYVGFAITDESTRETSVSGLNSLWAVNDEEPGRLVIGFSNAYGCKGDGYLVTLLFRSGKTGSFAIDLKDVVYSTYRSADAAVTTYTKVDSVLTTLSIVESFPEPSAEPTPSATPTASAAPSSTPDPTVRPSATPTAKTEDEPTEKPEPSRVPTATPTRKPRQTPTAKPTNVPTEVPTSIPTGTPVPTAEPTDVRTAPPTVEPIPIADPTSVPTDAPLLGSLVLDGEGGCSTFSNASLGILLLDIGIAFLALQIIIVVLIILRRRKAAEKSNSKQKPKRTTLMDDEDDDLDFTKR